MEPNWSREIPRGFWDPPRRLLRSIRRYQAAAQRGDRFGRAWWVLQHRFWSAVTGADIPLTVRIGGGLSMPHANGIVIHPEARIGENCQIMHQVTLGTNGSGHPPILGNAVDIGPGAKVLGSIRIGDGALVGALTLVLKDVAPNDVVYGVPARSTGKRADEVRARMDAPKIEGAD